MATCSNCGARHRRRRGTKDPRPASYCAECHATYMRRKYRVRMATSFTALRRVLCCKCKRHVQRFIPKRKPA